MFGRFGKHWNSKPAVRLLAVLLAGALAGCGAPPPSATSHPSAVSSAPASATSSKGSPSGTSAEPSAGSPSKPVGSSAASAAPSGSRSVPHVSKISKSEKIAYLTFDDGPTKLTPAVLDILKKNNVKATFFIAFMGSDSIQKRDWIRQEAGEGHTIGLHSWTHKYPLIYASEANFLKDFDQMRRVIIDATGVDPQICRFPGGTGNTVSIKYHGGKPIMPKLVEDVEKMGIKPFDWTAGGEDGQLPRPKNGAQFVSKIIRDIGSQTQPIILMHDRWPVTVEALPLLIGQLKAKGYGFGTLGPEVRDVMQKPALKR